MSSRRVTVPATPGLSWIVTVRELCLGEARAASPESRRDLEASFVVHDDGETLATRVSRIAGLLSYLLETHGIEAGDEWPSEGESTD